MYKSATSLTLTASPLAISSSSSAAITTFGMRKQLKIKTNDLVIVETKLPKEKEHSIPQAIEKEIAKNVTVMEAAACGLTNVLNYVTVCII